MSTDTPVRGQVQHLTNVSELVDKFMDSDDWLFAEGLELERQAIERLLSSALLAEAERVRREVTKELEAKYGKSSS